MKTLLTNAKVWLNNYNFTDSIGFDSESGKIIYVGDSLNVNKKDYTEIIDLNKRLILPAFSEGHCHLVKGSLVNFSEINLYKISTKKELIEKINEVKSKLKPGCWIEGANFSDTNFIDKFILDRNFLDSICPDIPVVISRLDLHSAIINSKAIEISLIQNKINDFSTSEIICDNQNNLTGEVKERARFFVLNCIPQKTISDLSQYVKQEIQKMNSLGIVEISDVTWDGDLDIYKHILEKDEMTLKINSMLRFQNYPYLQTYQKELSRYKNYIRLNTFKEFYDGSLSSESGYFWDNYKNKNHNGIKTDFILNGNFEKYALEIDKNGYQLAVHAIGDKAISELLDFNEMLISKNGKRDRRFRIEHAQHIRFSDLPRFKKLNIISSVQPSHLYVDAKVASDKLINPDTTHIYKKLIDDEAKVIFGTDFPVAQENPLETIYYAMTRVANGFPEGFKKEYSIDLINCLNAYMSNFAYANFIEDEKGNLEEGKLADLIVLENDLFSISPEEIKETKVLKTFLNGKQIY